MIFRLSNIELKPKPVSSNYDRLYKVRVFLTSLQKKIKKFASPETDMCMDEQMIPFKGQHSLKVYMKN